MPFRHPDRSHGLSLRIEMEVRERLEEAVDHVCLEALVRARVAAGLPPPAADSVEDRHAYTASVLAFLRLLDRELASGVGPPEPARPPAGPDPADEPARLVIAQVALARRLPDYWQRFEALSVRFLEAGDSAQAGTPASGGEGGGLLRRLFGRR